MKNGAISILLLLAFVSLGCGFGKLFAGKSGDSNSNSSNVRTGDSINALSNNSDPSGAPPESARVYKALEDKANELGNSATTVALDSKAPIKGKLAIVNKKYDFSEDFYIEGFDVYMTEFASDYDLERWGIKKEELAATPDEIDTLVRIKCKRGKKIGSYSSGGKSIPAYAMVCGVEMIDHKTSTVFAQKTFTNNELLDSITTSSTKEDHVALQPTREIGNYIKSFPRS